MAQRRSSITPGNPKLNVSGLYIDLPSILHTVAQIVYGYGKNIPEARIRQIERMNPRSRASRLRNIYIKSLTMMLLRTYDRFQPIHLFMVAADGIPPVAKMDQQRQRRWKGTMLGTPPPYFDPNNINPGTPFMRYVDSKLQKWFLDMQNRLALTIVYSSHLTPGEAEHKIFDRIRAGGLHLDMDHIVWGLDADLLVLSTLATTIPVLPSDTRAMQEPTDIIRMPRIYLARVEIKLEEVNGGRPQSRALQQVAAAEGQGKRWRFILEVQEILRVDELRSYIMSEMQLASSLEDFAVLTCVLGNDFLPRHPSFPDPGPALESLITLYKEFRTPLTTQSSEGLQLSIPALNAIFYRLAQTEATALARQYQRENGLLILPGARSRGWDIPSRFLKSAVKGDEFDFGLFRENWYLNEFGFPPNGITTQMIESMCQSYLEAYAWVLNYYVKGTRGANFEFSYPYLHAPLFYDLYIYTLDPKPLIQWQASNSSLDLNSLRAYEHMLAVLPPRSRNLLPQEFRFLMQTRNSAPIDGQFVQPWSPIADFYPCQISIEQEGIESRDFSEPYTLAILPPLIFSRFRDVVGRMREAGMIAPRTEQNFEPPRGDWMYTRDENAQRTLQAQRVLTQFREERLAERARGRGGRGRGVPRTGVQSNQPNVATVQAVSTQTTRGRGRGAPRGGRGGFREARPPTTESRTRGRGAPRGRGATSGWNEQRPIF